MPAVASAARRVSWMPPALARFATVLDPLGVFPQDVTADFVVTSFNADTTSVIEGEWVTFDATVDNLGADAGNAGLDLFVRSSATTPSASDTPAAFLEPGVHSVSVRATDDYGNAGAPMTVLLVVYDPAGGFVTGGGWIDSPTGAYAAQPDLAGKASFGFVSKYGRGASVPNGQAEFHFAAGDFTFRGSELQWLVVNRAGTNAQFKGEGTVNGGNAPDGEPYRFMIWAGDGERAGTSDAFRIRVCYEDAGDVEHVVYDNGALQPIGGGSIVVHSK